MVCRAIMGWRLTRAKMPVEGFEEMVGFEQIAENRIWEAMERGEFDGLAASGKPIDLDEYFKCPGTCAWVTRF